MGRTKRNRKNRKTNIKLEYLDSEVDTINFVKWMTNKNWINENKLRIAKFPDTGRGVLSEKTLKANDVLIEVPLDLLISYKTLEENILFKSYLRHCSTLLSIHELLAVFVLIELHVGIKSPWYNYIKYLPNKNEIMLPWFCTLEEINCLPEEIRIPIEDCRNNLEESWHRIETILNTICQHCNNTISHIIDRRLYEWAYTVVNTRAVYIDPGEIKKMSGISLEKILADEPTMALCPYLDMFNHSSAVTVKAVLRTNETMPKYCLIIGNDVRKYKEIFISYGAHDNKKLLTQYGFILPENQFDQIDFNLKDIISVCNINTTNRQYKFLCDHSLNNDISVNNVKFSFNMNAVLYVLSHKNDLDWSIRVYTSIYTREQLRLMYALAEVLLKWKLKQYEKELENLKQILPNCTPYFSLCVDYLKYRINFIKQLIDI